MVYVLAPVDTIVELFFLLNKDNETGEEIVVLLNIGSHDDVY
jgi:hypothetical protein